MDIVGFEIEVDDIRMPPAPPRPNPRALTLKNTHRHTGQVNEDKHEGSSKRKCFTLDPVSGAVCGDERT